MKRKVLVMPDGRVALVASFEGNTVPDAFQVFPAGTVEIEGGEPFLVDDPAMNAVVEKFAARGLDMVIDYEHQTLGGEFASPTGQAPAAGWIKALENRGPDGLWARVEWSERAREYLEKREYRYYSPVFLVSKGAERRLLELLNVALTNFPRLNWIRPIVSKHQPSSEETRMELLKIIAKALGLKEDATQEEVLAAVAKLKTPPSDVVACKDVLDALGLQAGAGKSEVVATVHALRQRPETSVLQEIASLKERLAVRDRDDLVAAALKDGKISPAQREWADAYALRDPEGFRLFTAKAPVVVPLGGNTVPNSTGTPGAGADAGQLEINRMMGIDEETWKKYGPKQD